MATLWSTIETQQRTGTNESDFKTREKDLAMLPPGTYENDIRLGSFRDGAYSACR